MSLTERGVRWLEDTLRKRLPKVALEPESRKVVKIRKLSRIPALRDHEMCGELRIMKVVPRYRSPFTHKCEGLFLYKSAFKENNAQEGGNI